MGIYLTIAYYSIINNVASAKVWFFWIYLPYWFLLVPFKLIRLMVNMPRYFRTYRSYCDRKWNEHRTQLEDKQDLKYRQVASDMELLHEWRCDLNAKRK
jgi:hypothetical protein